MSGVRLGAIAGELAGRVGAARPDDPVMPFVTRTARAIFRRMSADVQGDTEGVRRAEEEYEEIVEDARVLAERWRAEGRGRLARRLEILLRKDL
jgi:hypothetical protein